MKATANFGDVQIRMTDMSAKLGVSAQGQATLET